LRKRDERRAEHALQDPEQHDPHQRLRRRPLRAGMSVEVNVDTGHQRGLPQFLTALFGHTPRKS